MQQKGLIPSTQKLGTDELTSQLGIAGHPISFSLGTQIFSHLPQECCSLFWNVLDLNTTTPDSGFTMPRSDRFSNPDL